MTSVLAKTKWEILTFEGVKFEVYDGASSSYMRDGLRQILATYPGSSAEFKTVSKMIDGELASMIDLKINLSKESAKKSYDKFFTAKGITGISLGDQLATARMVWREMKAIVQVTIQDKDNWPSRLDQTIATEQKVLRLVKSCFTGYGGSISKESLEFLKKHRDSVHDAIDIILK